MTKRVAATVPLFGLVSEWYAQIGLSGSGVRRGRVSVNPTTGPGKSPRHLLEERLETI